MANLGNLFIDGEGTINDETENHVVDINTGVLLDTEEKVYGVSSLKFDNSSYVTFSDSDYLNIGTGDFTIDMWVKRNNWNSHDALFCINNYAGNNVCQGMLVSLHATTDNIAIFNANSYGVVAPTGTTAGEWFHIAFIRESGSLKTYVNGELVGSRSMTSSITHGNNGITLGSYGNMSSNPLDGNLDRFRLIKGEALWTANFDINSLEEMFYDVPPPSTYQYLSGVYDVSSVKGNLRGRAKSGFVRPTIEEFFTSNDYEQVESGPGELVGYTEDLLVDPNKASATGFQSPGTAPSLAINGLWDYSSYTNNWYYSSPSSQAWWKYDFSTQKTIIKYTIRAGSSKGIWAYAPKNWTFEGSNDDSEWTVLDTINNQTWTEGEKKDFTIDNSNAFRYYRVNIDNVSGNWINMGEIEMMEGIYE